MAETTVVISYNSVSGFSSGWHGDGRLFVCANDNGRGAETGDGENQQRRAGSVMHKISGTYYRGSVPVENVQRFVVYAGLNALQGAIAMAKGLRYSAPETSIIVAACHCDWEEKRDLLRGTGIELIECECGGDETLGRIAKQALAN